MKTNRNRLVRIAVLAMSLLAPLSLRAQGAPPPLSPLLQSKMVTLVTAKGSDGKIAPRFANALGLSAAGQAWGDRQIVATDQGVIHYVGVGPGANSELLLTERTPKLVAAFRVSRDGRLLSALSLDVPSKAITLQSPSQVQAAFAAECGFWARHIDGLLAQK